MKLWHSARISVSQKKKEVLTQNKPCLLAPSSRAAPHCEKRDLLFCNMDNKTDSSNDHIRNDPAWAMNLDLLEDFLKTHLFPQLTGN